LICLAKVVAKEGAAHGVRGNVICSGFVRPPLVEKQIPDQARELGISEEAVVKTVMLKDSVDGEVTTVEDIAHRRPQSRRFSCHSRTFARQGGRRRPASGLHDLRAWAALI